MNEVAFEPVRGRYVHLYLRQTVAPLERNSKHTVKYSKTDVL